MTKDQTFRLRLDTADRERLKAVAAHYSAPESTAVRILIKEKHDAIKAASLLTAGDDDFRWGETHDHILGIIFDDSKSEPVPSDEISRRLAEGENRGSAFYDHTTFKTEVPRALNALARNGYLRRLKSGYVLTPKGKAAADE